MDFGAPASFGAHLFRVEIPDSRRRPVLIIEDYGYRGLEGGIPRDEERVASRASCLVGDRRHGPPRVQRPSQSCKGTHRPMAQRDQSRRSAAWQRTMRSRMGRRDCERSDRFLSFAANGPRYVPKNAGGCSAMTVAEAGLPTTPNAVGDAHCSSHSQMARSRPWTANAAVRWSRTSSNLAPVRGFQMSEGVTPFSLKDAPALIERLLPVQKLSAEAYKEQMAVHR